jgi:hypothetical protein
MGESLAINTPHASRRALLNPDPLSLSRRLQNSSNLDTWHLRPFLSSLLQPVLRFGEADQLNERTTHGRVDTQVLPTRQTQTHEVLLLLPLLLRFRALHPVRH